MSAVKPVPPSVATYIDVFDEAILWSQTRGLPGDWYGLRRKLDTLVRRARMREAEEHTGAPDWAHRLEHKLLIEVLRELLLPAVLDDLVEALRSGEPGDVGVWSPLDRKALERYREREVSADAGVLAALKGHAKKPRHVRVLEGLRALQDLFEARVCLDPLFEAAVLVKEGKQLVEVVETILPPTARLMLSFEVEARFRSHVEEKAIDELEPARAFWHHHLEGLDVWHPVWIALRSPGDHPDPLGTWFVPGIQATYEEVYEQVVTNRRKKAEDEKRKQRAAAAKRRRQQQKEADQRELQARLDREELIRRQERERKRRAEAEKEEQQIRMHHEEQQCERRAEYEQIQQEQRQARIEMIRRNQQPSSALDRRYWLRADERKSRWVVAEWERWCQSKGMSPHEFSDEDRERFIRRIW